MDTKIIFILHAPLFILMMTRLNVKKWGVRMGNLSRYFAD
jgi:hypothetical protein